jgi:hypothetical protein
MPKLRMSEVPSVDCQAVVVGWVEKEGCKNSAIVQQE